MLQIVFLSFPPKKKEVTAGYFTSFKKGSEKGNETPASR